MKLYVAYFLDGRSPWSTRQETMRRCAAFEVNLAEQGHEIINFSSPSVCSEGSDVSTEHCIRVADAVLGFQDGVMLGVSPMVSELAHRYHKSVFEFVLNQRPSSSCDFKTVVCMSCASDFCNRPILITGYDDVFAWLTPSEIVRTQKAIAP